jgi:hypothetical protein
MMGAGGLQNNFGHPESRYAGNDGAVLAHSGRMFSSEVVAGSRQENASHQQITDDRDGDDQVDQRGEENPLDDRSGVICPPIHSILIVIVTSSLIRRRRLARRYDRISLVELDEGERSAQPEKERRGEERRRDGASISAVTILSCS